MVDTAIWDFLNYDPYNPAQLHTGFEQRSISRLACSTGQVPDLQRYLRIRISTNWDCTTTGAVEDNWFFPNIFSKEIWQRKLKSRTINNYCYYKNARQSSYRKTKFYEIAGATPRTTEPQKMERKRINIVIKLYRLLFLARALLSVFTIFLLM